MYEDQIIPDPVFPDPFSMLFGGCEGYCENRRTYYFRAIDSGFWHQEAICLGFNFLAKVLLGEAVFASLERHWPTLVNPIESDRSPHW